MIESSIFIGRMRQAQKRLEPYALYCIQARVEDERLKKWPRGPPPKESLRWRDLRFNVSLDYIAGYLDSAFDHQVMKGDVFVYNGFYREDCTVALKFPPNATDTIPHVKAEQLDQIDEGTLDRIVRKTSIRSQDSNRPRLFGKRSKPQRKKNPRLILEVNWRCWPDVELFWFWKHGNERPRGEWYERPEFYD